MLIFFPQFQLHTRFTTKLQQLLWREYKADGHDFAGGKRAFQLQRNLGAIQWEAVLLHVKDKFPAKVVKV